MPCHLPEEINYVSDDVFSYMCNLAMEKCSRKTEKKKASCGGAAMRKRLLIKNFVAQMLEQEKQTREEQSGFNDYRDRKESSSHRKSFGDTSIYSNSSISSGNSSLNSTIEMQDEADDEDESEEDQDDGSKEMEEEEEEDEEENHTDEEDENAMFEENAEAEAAAATIATTDKNKKPQLQRNSISDDVNNNSINKAINNNQSQRLVISKTEQFNKFRMFRPRVSSTASEDFNPSDETDHDESAPLLHSYFTRSKTRRSSTPLLPCWRNNTISNKQPRMILEEEEEETEYHKVPMREDESRLNSPTTIDAHFFRDPLTTSEELMSMTFGSAVGTGAVESHANGWHLYETTLDNSTMTTTATNAALDYSHGQQQFDFLSASVENLLMNTSNSNHHQLDKGQQGAKPIVENEKNADEDAKLFLLERAAAGVYGEKQHHQADESQLIGLVNMMPSDNMKFSCYGSVDPLNHHINNDYCYYTFQAQNNISHLTELTPSALSADGDHFDSQQKYLSPTSFIARKRPWSMVFDEDNCTNNEQMDRQSEELLGSENLGQQEQQQNNHHNSSNSTTNQTAAAATAMLSPLCCGLLRQQHHCHSLMMDSACLGGAILPQQQPLLKRVKL